MSFGRPYENRDIDSLVDAQIILQERERVQTRIDAVLEQRAPLEAQVSAVRSRLQEILLEQTDPVSVVAQREQYHLNKLYLRLTREKTPLDREVRSLLQRDIALISQFNIVSSLQF